MSMMESFKRASQTTIPFGKHKGETLDHVASTDDGLRYLDWLASGDVPLFGQFKEAFLLYMSDSSIQKEIARVIR